MCLPKTNSPYLENISYSEQHEVSVLSVSVASRTLGCASVLLSCLADSKRMMCSLCCNR